MSEGDTTMERSRREARRRRGLVLGLVLLATVAAACHRLVIVDDPSLVEEDLFVTRPFVGTSTKMFDAEEMAYVPSDGTLWLADDNGDRLHEIDAATGVLLSTIERVTFAATPQFGGGPLAGADRTGDLEGVAYDPVADLLYVVSDGCCSPTTEPTIFRLPRTGPTFVPDSWQPLVDDIPALAVTPEGDIYASGGTTLHAYDYPSNTLGSPFSISGMVGGIFGMSFSEDGFDLWIGTGVRVYRVDWDTKTVVPDYVFDFADHGLGDARAVGIIGDRLYVQDGDDSLASTDPLKYAIHIYRIEGVTSSPVKPIASFTATPEVGLAPLSVTFDASASSDPDGTIVAWHWYSEDEIDETPTFTPTLDHEFADPGVYTVYVLVEDDGETYRAVPRQVTVKEPNVAPLLDPIGGQVADEGIELSFTATGADTNVPVDVLTFSLDDGAAGAVPAGAAITAGGDFTWTPTESQAPGVFTFDVVVTDDGIPAMEDRETITVVVGGGNSAPILDPIGDKSATELEELSFTATASDPDTPPSGLTFSLDDGLDGAVPAGASISANGDFTWTPTEAQAPGVFTFDVVVTDDGAPALEDRETISVNVDEAVGIRSIATGVAHSCAVPSDGTVWCWGQNDKGQLGDDTGSDSDAPVQVTGVGGVGVLGGVVDLAAGTSSTCAVTSAGEVFCWGLNNEGQLGDNSGSDSDAPVRVVGAGGVGTFDSAVLVVAGEKHTCASRADGTVWCWGKNDKGQLGDDTGSDSEVPVQSAL